jgi:hypothetical protein
MKSVLLPVVYPRLLSFKNALTNAKNHTTFEWSLNPIIVPLNFNERRFT